MIAATCYGLPVHNSPKQISDPNPTSQVPVHRSKSGPLATRSVRRNEPVAKTQ